jgi:transposase
MTSSTKTLYAGHRFPPELISDTVWLYFRFPLSLRMVEEMLAFRGIEVSHETIRQWGLKLGQEFANLIRRRLPRPGDTWPLDEVVLKIAGKTHYLWRAVDQHGVVLDVLVQRCGNGAASSPRYLNAGDRPSHGSSERDPSRSAPEYRGGTAVEYFAAIDVSLELSSVCVVDGAGKIVRETKVASEPDALIQWFRETGLTLTRIGLEAGPLSQWLHAGLVAAGFPAILIATRHVKAALSAMIVKTDRNDARGMAQLMRMGWFRPVHAKTLPAQEIRALLTGRKLLQAKLLDLEIGLRGLLRGFGLKVGEVSKSKYEARIRERVAGHRMLEHIAEPMLRARAVLRAEYATLHRQVLRLVRADEVCRLFMTVPGVGSVVAVTDKAAIDDPRRFHKSKDVGPHFGVTPKKYQSGEVDWTGGISKVGDAMVRTALYEAATVLLSRVTRFSALKAWAMGVMKRRGLKKARVALARKLAIVLHRMWVDGTPFQWGNAPAQGAA